MPIGGAPRRLVPNMAVLPRNAIQVQADFARTAPLS